MSRMKRFVGAVILQQVFLVLLVLLWLWLKSRPAEMVVSVRRAEKSEPAGPRAEPVAKPVQTTGVATKADNLRRIEGIGPKIAAALQEAGIRSYAQLAAQEASQIKAILDAAGVRLAFPETWPEQARYASRGDWEGLAAFQATLKGGRRVDSN